MLDFFRRYQRYFFIVITVVIIISFSFFGTYSTLNNVAYHEQVAFTAVDGSSVKRSEVDQMALFLGTDAQDKLIYGGHWGPNFLNDGVIVKDFFQTGMAEELGVQYASDINEELLTRLEKEKRYKPYAHPQAQFLSMESAWNYLAPEVSRNYNALRLSTSPTSPDALNARFNLYMAQRDFPAPAVRQVLLYQQRQYNWLQPDPALESKDLSLFGYHTVDDWFGPRFMRIIAQFVINSAKIAEQKGYQVSKQEALADLMRNSEASYAQVVNNPNLGVANSNEYFNTQLQRMGLDANKASGIWRQVMLFRRLFHDVGNAVFVDPLTYQKVNTYAKTTIEGQLYRLPDEFHFNSNSSMQKFEAYLNAISKQQGPALTLPQQFYTPAEVAKKAPELIQKRYLITLAEVNKNALQAKVAVRESWNWEVDNWAKLTKQFPDLANKKSNTRDERYAALDSLDEKARDKVDAYARKEIVETHPEWLQKALQEVEPKRTVLAVPLKGGKAPLVGVTDREALMASLDTAKLNAQDESLAAFSADGVHYYRIVVLDRSPDLEIVTFAEAQEGDLLANKTVDKAYSDKLSNAIKTDSGQGQKEMLEDIVASLRLNAYAKETLAQIKKDPQGEANWIQPKASQEGAQDKLPPHPALADQWKFIKSPYQADRGDDKIDLADAFTLQPNGWSKVHTPVSGDLYFFQLIKKGSNATVQALDETVHKARNLLSDNAQRVLTANLLRTMKEKRAISLDYLNKQPEMEDAQSD